MNEWERRIRRAEDLGAQYGFAAEILRFYAAIARFQEKLFTESEKSKTGIPASDPQPFAQAFASKASQALQNIFVSGRQEWSRAAARGCPLVARSRRRFAFPIADGFLGSPRSWRIATGTL